MSSPGFKRWGATTGASGASSYGHSRSDGTQYVSPSEAAKSKDKKKDKPAKKAEKPSKPSSPSPKPGKAAVAYSSSPKPSTHASSSSPEVVKSGLNTTTYEKQPDWAFSERSKNSSGQYRDGMFQGSANANNSSPTVSKASGASSPSSSPKPAASPAKTSPSTTPGWAQKPVQTTFNNKPASPKPAVASYQVGGQGNSQSAYGSQTGGNSSPAVVKSGLNTTTYEKQPDWAYAERSKNANGQYKDGMFQSGGAKVTYGSSSASPSQLRAGGHLR